MNRRRLENLERHFQPDDDVSLVDYVAEMNRLRAWVVEKGFGTDFEPDYHGALAAGLKAPPGFRHATLDELAHASEHCTIYRWVAEWGYVLQARQRLADPCYDTDYFREHLNSQIERCTRNAEEAHAKLARWGVSQDDALSRARSMYSETQPNGYRMPDEELESITAAILDAGQGGVSGQ